MNVMFDMLSVNIKDITIIALQNIDYRCIIHNISKSEIINLLKSAMLENRACISNNIVFIFSLFILIFLYSIYKMVHIMDIYIVLKQ